MKVQEYRMVHVPTGFEAQWRQVSRKDTHWMSLGTWEDFGDAFSQMGEMMLDDARDGFHVEFVL